MQLKIFNPKDKITQLQEQLDMQTISEKVLKKNTQLLKFYTGMSIYLHCDITAVCHIYCRNT